MPVISFDYSLRPYLKNGKLGALYTPLIPIRISAHHTMYPYQIHCLLDSGADFNLLPAAVGEKLGLKIKKGIKREHIGIGNIGIIAYTHTVKLYVGSYNFFTEIDFSYDHRIPLLGRDGFFRNFKEVAFDEQKLKIKLKY